jgi:hypothetical protein
MGGMPGTGVHEPEERAQDDHVHHDERQELRAQLQAEPAKTQIGVGIGLGDFLGLRGVLESLKLGQGATTTTPLLGGATVLPWALVATTTQVNVVPTSGVVTA